MLTGHDEHVKNKVKNIRLKLHQMFAAKGLGPPLNFDFEINAYLC